MVGGRWPELEAALGLGEERITLNVGRRNLGVLVLRGMRVRRSNPQSAAS